MAGGKMSWFQRQELMSILHYVYGPSSSPEEYFKQRALHCFLNGIDAQKYLEEKLGLPAFVAVRFVEKARVWIGNERGKRRNKVPEILKFRGQYVKPEFTSENFRVTMDFSQDRNYGMVNTSIYSVVEVWLDEKLEKEYLVNYSDFKTKEWLTRLLVWALMNKHEVLIKPAGETEMNSMKMFVPKDKVIST